MLKNSQWSFSRSSPNNISKVLMYLTTSSPLGSSYNYSCSVLLKMWVPYILLKFFRVGCSDLVLKVSFWSFSSSFLAAKDKGENNSVDCHPYLSMSVGLNVQTQTVRSTLLRKERPPEVLRNSCVTLWTVGT